MIGTTRSRVSFFMNKFRKLGMISYDGHVEVHSSLLTAVLQDKPRLKGGSFMTSRAGESDAYLGVNRTRWAPTSPLSVHPIIFKTAYFFQRAEEFIGIE
jgi:hypothetical protein